MESVKMVSLISALLIPAVLALSSYHTILLVSAASAPQTTPSGYATKPFAYMYNCNFTSHATLPAKNTTTIAFNQQEYKANHWNLNATLGPDSGYSCMVKVIPSHLAARYGLH